VVIVKGFGQSLVEGMMIALEPKRYLHSGFFPLGHSEVRVYAADVMNKSEGRFTFIFVVLLLFSSFCKTQLAQAQGSRFFRISGPAATKIIAFRPDGSLVWSNALAPTNYFVQTATSLRGGTNWVDYVQLPVTNAINTNLLVAFHPPAGMSLVPAGLFTIGDAVDGNYWGNAAAASVYVSAFYMDVNLVSYSLWQSIYSWAANHGYDFGHSGSSQGMNNPVQHVNSAQGCAAGTTLGHWRLILCHRIE
jgi:hypothetical protein